MVRDEAGQENGADCPRRLPSLRARAALPDRAVRSLAWTVRRAAAARHPRLPASQSRSTVQIPAVQYRGAQIGRSYFSTPVTNAHLVFLLFLSHINLFSFLSSFSLFFFFFF